MMDYRAGSPPAATPFVTRCKNWYESDNGNRNFAKCWAVIAFCIAAVAAWRLIGLPAPF